MTLRIQVTETVERATLIACLSRPSRHCRHPPMLNCSIRLITDDGRTSRWRHVMLSATTGPDSENEHYYSVVSLLWLEPRMLPHVGDWIEVYVRDRHVKHASISWG